MRNQAVKSADSGILESADALFTVNDTQKYGQVFGHIGELKKGEIKVGQTLHAVVDAERRQATSLTTPQLTYYTPHCAKC